MISLFLVAIARRAQSTQNKFANYLQYLKKEMRDEVDFDADKHKSCLQVDSIIFDGSDEAYLKYLSIYIKYLRNISRKK